MAQIDEETPKSLISKDSLKIVTMRDVDKERSSISDFKEATHQVEEHKELADKNAFKGMQMSMEKDLPQFGQIPVVRKANLLVVDDDATNIFVMQSMLETKGVSTDTAFTGAAAIELVKKRIEEV